MNIHEKQPNTSNPLENHLPNWFTKLPDALQRETLAKGFTIPRNPLAAVGNYWASSYQNLLRPEVSKFLESRKLEPDKVKVELIKSMEWLSKHKMINDISDEKKEDLQKLDFDTERIKAHLEDSLQVGLLTSEKFKTFLEENKPIPLETVRYWLFRLIDIWNEAKFQLNEGTISTDEFEQIIKDIGIVDTRVLINSLLEKQFHQKALNQLVG